MFCCAHLLNNVVEKAMHDLDSVHSLYRSCIKLVKYFKVNPDNSPLNIAFKSYAPSRWNSMFCLFVTIEKYWSEIVEQLQEAREGDRIKDIEIVHIREVIKVMLPFETVFQKLEDDKMPTLHLVCIYAHHLKKKCAETPLDHELSKQLKENLLKYLKSIVDTNLTILHKVALFLFPPTNKLIQFESGEKELVKNECKRLMVSYRDVPNHSTRPSITQTYTDDAFSDFVNETEVTRSTTDLEMASYENNNVRFEQDFDVLEWWELHKSQYPLLYKLSCKVFSTPATSAASEKVYEQARCLISEKRCNVAGSDSTINQIMFLHENADEGENYHN